MKYLRAQHMGQQHKHEVPVGIDPYAKLAMAVIHRALGDWLALRPTYRDSAEWFLLYDREIAPLWFRLAGLDIVAVREELKKGMSLRGAKVS